MADLRRAFAAAGFTDVTTVLASGNVVFSTRAAPPAALARRAETAMARELGRPFLTFVRPIDGLRGLLAQDPYNALRLPAGAKRVVTFLRERPAAVPALPL
jgi:uncharacterized protein (DUF1697 family)